MAELDAYEAAYRACYPAAEPERERPPGRAGGAFAAELARLRFIEQQVTELASEWHRVSDADEAPQHGYDALILAAHGVEDTLRAAGSGAPVNHLAEAMRHLALLQDELAAPLLQRHPMTKDERVRWRAARGLAPLLTEHEQARVRDLAGRLRDLDAGG